MVKAAKVIIIIGLALGGLGAIASVGVFAFSGPMLEWMQRLAPQVPEASAEQFAQSMETFKAATERTLSGTLSIFGRCILVAAGGTFGLIAASKSTRKTAMLVFGIVTAVCGIGLLLTQNWICAAAYVIGGFLLILESNKEESKEAPPEGSAPRE